MSIVYVSEFHGCVYAICEDLDSDGDYLIQTPMFNDGTYDTDQDNWCEVDELALLGEEQDHQLEVEHAWDVLRRERDGIFADPAKYNNEV